MSLYPLKIAEPSQNFKFQIQILKSSLDKSLEALIARNPTISSDLKDLKSSINNLYSEFLLGYEKEKEKNKDLVSQFDQVQQEAALEFNLRQSDFVKQIDLFEAELKRLRHENRSIYDQLDSSFRSSENLKKSLNTISSEILTAFKSNSSFQNCRELEGKLKSLKNLVEKHSENCEKSPGQCIEPAISVESRSFEYIQKSSASSSREKQGLGIKLENLKFISDKSPGQITTDRGSLSSLNSYLENIYIKSLGFAETKEKFNVVKIENMNKDWDRQGAETFRTGSDAQIGVNDSFMTLDDSPVRQGVSNIFPELEESPCYKFKLKL